MAGATRRIRIGRIVGAFGLKGEVKVEPLTDFWERFEVGNSVHLQGVPYKIVSFRVHKKRPLVGLEGVKDISMAEELQWQYLEADEDGRPALDENQYVTQDLIGMIVKTDQGRVLGVLNEVLSSAAHDILVIGPVMVPAVSEFVKDIDLDKREIVVSLIPGMLPEEGAEVDVS